MNENIERNYNLVPALVHHYVSRFPRYAPHYPELHAAATDGLIQAAQTYDPDAGTPFRFWARSIMYHRILDAARAIRREMCRETVDVDEVGDTLAAPGEPDVLARVDAARIWRRARKVLSRSDRDTLWAWTHGEPLASIGQRSGVSRQAVHARIQRITAKLRSP